MLEAMMPSKEEKLWAASAHLSYLLGLPVVLPLILFLWKRDQSPFIAEQAKQAIGLHIVTFVVVLLAVLFSFGTLGVGALAAIPLVSLFCMLTMIFTIVAVIKIAEGQTYHYPLFGNWIARL